MKISPKKHWEENISLIMIIMGFIDLLSEQIHEIVKWPMIGIGLLSIILCFTLHKINNKCKTIIFLSIIWIGVELAVPHGILATQYIWDIGICMPVGLCMCYANTVNPKKWIALYMAVTIFLVMRIFTAADHYTILLNHSRNYISVFEIFILFLIAFTSYKDGKTLPNWIYYAVTVTCMIAVGRGGIIASILIFVLHIINQIHEENGKNKSSRIILLIMAGMVLVFIFVFFQDYIIQRFFPRFSHAGVYSKSSDIAVNKRFLMWGEYLNQILHSVNKFIFGADPNPILRVVHYIYDFNLHNSFLMTHVFYGMPGLFVLFYFLIKSVRRFLNEGQVELVIILLGFIVRAFTDHCFPGKLSGIIVWLTIFYGANSRKHHNIQTKAKVSNERFLVNKQGDCK